MTSTTKVRWCEAAVLVSWSIASRMRCSAVSAPIVMSVPTMSLHGTDQADNDQGRVGVGKLLRDNTLGDQLGDMLGPLVAELIRTRQRTIAANDDEVVDTVLEQVRGGAVASLVGTELSAASRADNRATLSEDRGNIRPLHLLNGAAAVACTLPAFKDRIGLRSPGQSRAHHCANGSIHTLASPPEVRTPIRTVLIVLPSFIDGEGQVARCAYRGQFYVTYASYH